MQNYDFFAKLQNVFSAVGRNYLQDLQDFANFSEQENFIINRQLPAISTFNLSRSLSLSKGRPTPNS